MKEKIKLNLGCGIRVVKGFINVDAYVDEEKMRSKTDAYEFTEWDEGAVFVKGDMRNLPFKDNYADYIECTDAIEHISHRDIGKVFREFYRVLKPNGCIKLMTVDFDELARLWTSYSSGECIVQHLNGYIDLFQIIYGSQVNEGEFHRMPFNPTILYNLLLATGFEKDKIRIDIIKTGSVAKKYFETHPDFKGERVVITQMIMATCFK